MALSCFTAGWWRTTLHENGADDSKTPAGRFLRFCEAVIGRGDARQQPLPDRSYLATDLHGSSRMRRKADAASAHPLLIQFICG
jgi:hypothetical protein